MLNSNPLPENDYQLLQLTEEEFRRRYAYSTLQYFHKELGLTQKG